MSKKSKKGPALLVLALLALLGMREDEEEPEPDPERDGPDGFAPIDPVGPGPEPDPEPEPEPDPEPEDHTPAIDDIVNPDWPVPGHFYRVRQGDNGLKVAKRALADAAYRAGKDLHGMTVNDARSFASQISGKASLQYAYLDAITCEAWNDATVTTFGYGNLTRPAPGSRRAIRFVPQHANNVKRLRQGKPALREMHFGTAADHDNGKRRTGRAGGEFETLYMPGVDLEALGEGELKLGGGKWPDGSSKRHPPKWVLALGVKDRSKSVPTGKRKRGCGSSKKIEVMR